jgi:8-oxo-dGTP diphosphatase
MESFPVFGKKKDSIVYHPRPGAYGVMVDDRGLVATILMRRRSYLPGGGQEQGESIIDCLKRELIEELGCEFDMAEPVGRADEHFKSLHEEKYYLWQGHFFLIPEYRLIAEPTDKTQTVEWLKPERALAGLFHLSQRWGLTKALERR